MEHKLTVTMKVVVNAPTVFDANELIEDTFGDAGDIQVTELTVKSTRK